MQETQLNFLVVKIHWRMDRLLTPVFLGFPFGSVGKRIHLQCRKPAFDPWVGKIPWRSERLPTPVFSSGEFHGLYSPWGHKELDRTEQLSFTYTPSTGRQGSEQRHFSLAVRQRGRIFWGRLLHMIIITKAVESKSKKLFQYRVRVDFSLKQSSTVSSFHNLVEKRNDPSNCFVRWIFLGVSTIVASVPSVQICLYLFFLEKCLFYTYRFGNIELQTREAAFEVKEFSTFLCMWSCKN